MATKSAMIGDKRKSAPGSKGKPDGKTKKARLNKPESRQKPDPQSENESADLSDSDDGGVKLDSKSAKKPSKSGEGHIHIGKGGDNSQMQTSRETHAKQKQLAQERKAAKPLADEVQRTKKIWERLRVKSKVPKEERKQLVAELFGIITGRVRDFVLKHDAVRAVQTAIKYSTSEQRKQIAKELQGSYAQLAESRYAKFLIGKLLVHNDEEIRDIIIPNFYGKVRKLINHPEASWILDDIYRTVATKEQKALLLREWYGPEFAIRALTKDIKATAGLSEILENEPSKRGPIMKSLFEMINSLVQKRMTGFTMLHDAMLQYYRKAQVGTQESTEFGDLVKDDENGDLLKNLAFTKSGAEIVCLLMAHGTSKDRKLLMKAFKDTFVLMAGDQYAHLIILTAYDVIDDTKLTSKSIFPELLGEDDEEVAQNIVGAANDPNARTALLYPYEGLSKSLFPPSHAFDLKILEEVREIRKTTSKKDADVRRDELIAALSPHLLSVIAAAAADLTLTAFGCQFVADVLLSGAGDNAKALEAIAECATGDPKEVSADVPAEDGLAPKPHISMTPFGGRMLKSLIQGGRFDKATGKIIQIDPPLEFANTLYPVVKDYVVDWATGPSSFVVLGLVEAGNFGEEAALKKTLKKNKKLLEKAATEQTAEQKAAQEALEQSVSTDKGGKKNKKKGEAPVGNMGSKLLLEKL